MALATDADLLTYVAAAAAVSTALRALALEDAAEHVDSDLYGVKGRRAHAMLTAHFLATTPGSGMTGSATVASRSAGAISVSYAVPAVSDEDLSRTEYGKAFMAIRASVPHMAECV